MKKQGKINVAVAGVGYLGQWHARKLAAIKNVRLAAVVDINKDRADKIAAELGCSALNSIDELPDEVEGVIIAVPTGVHFDLANRLLDAGKDVLVEKPMVESVDDGRRLIKKAAEKNLILAVGHVERFNPAVAAAAGSIDRPFLIDSRRLAPLKERAKKIDVVRDLMIHDIDLVCSMTDGEATIVNATGATLVTDHIDVAKAHLRFTDPSGGETDAYLLASRLHAKEVRELDVFDAQGCMRINCRDRTACRFISANGEMVEDAFETTGADPLEEELKNFVNALRTRSEPEVTGDDGLKALALATGIIELINSR